ncbi:MAG: sulfatase-like hydrolase/transferase, partial [Bdellovibrionales bacterium]|nr:sulfatase-like hydrolase/transferase [Bdellovibrionales bacterium]
MTNYEKNYDIEIVKKYYPIVSEYLGVDKPDIEKLNFTRHQEPIAPTRLSQANVVVIIMESLSAHRSSLFGNPTEATAYMDSLGREGWNFTKNYTPSEGTARGVFATITGVADINKDRTSSRNPLIVDQNTAANYFTNYQPFYFIGGSANWGNIRGVLENNIKNLKLYEEGMFQAPRTDVWGVSDYHLFKETARILNERPNKSKPFLAFIQTAGFHRPYTIPEDRGNF